jgi:hypothetical protein
MPTLLEVNIPWESLPVQQSDSSSSRGDEEGTRAATTTGNVTIPRDLIPMTVLRMGDSKSMKHIENTFSYFGSFGMEEDLQDDATERKKKWMDILNNLRGTMASKAKMAAEIQVKEVAAESNIKIRNQAVTGMADVMEYLANPDNWVTDEMIKTNREFLYKVKYGIYKNKSASWCKDRENEWMIASMVEYEGSGKTCSSFRKMLTRKKEEVNKRLDRIELSVRGEVVRKQFNAEWWIPTGAVLGAKGKHIER